ncbi:MAG: phosphatase PAP2 family protein, partial [Rhizomicrobium sp.]
MATYATQRLDFPLRDDLFQDFDRAMGFDWMAYVTYVDARPVLATLTRWGYNTMSAQMALPLIVFAYLSKHRELRVYLATIAMSLLGVIFIAMLLPALPPLAHLAKGAFHNIRFSGITPVNELLRLRGSAPMLVDGDFGGMINFPSFHAVVGIVIPMVLRRTKLFAPLVAVNIALLSGTVTEGGHYFCDIVAGGVLGALAYLVADRLQRLEGSRRGTPDAPIAATALALSIPAE